MILRFLAFFAFASLIALFYVFSGAAGCAGPADASTVFPETCLEVQEQAVDETGERPANGTYTLYINGDESLPWDAYCYDMQRTEPLEFLTVEEEENFSQIRTDDAVAQTTYRRLRIDPIRLEINPLDDTFATNDFENYEPAFPVDGMESIPAGWAEVQPFAFNAGTPAEANVSLAGTPFTFDDSILADDLMAFFCQVDSAGVNLAYTNGTMAEVESDLISFHLTAVNTNSESNDDGISTREVADCDNLGTGATDFSSAAFPLQYTP